MKTTKITENAIKSAYENYSETCQSGVWINYNVGLPIDRFNPFKMLQNITRIGHKNHWNKQNNQNSAHEEQKTNWTNKRNKGRSLYYSGRPWEAWVDPCMAQVELRVEPQRTWVDLMVANTTGIFPVSFSTSSTIFRHFQIKLSYEI